MEPNSNDVITLQIQGKSVQCNRSILIQNSDYFRAMFEGNFMESHQTVIPLNGVDVVALTTILRLLWDQEHVMDEKIILSVLQASCMLQFLQVKEICLTQIEQLLSIRNCLKIWFCTENLNLERIFLKAKLLALLEFVSVKDTPHFFELELEELMNYLGNVNLQCRSEFDVFQAIIRWYQNLEEHNSDVLLKLLRCVSFTAATTEQINKMISDCNFPEHEEVCNVLKCVINIKNDTDVCNFEDECVHFAQILLQSRERNSNGFPCILVNKIEEKEENSTVLVYDRFKRKRKYSILEENPNTDFSVLYVDVPTSALKKFFDVDHQKCDSLDGFKMTGYKNFVFLYGGEYLIGKGNWNYDFHIYDIIQETWRRKKLPFSRRHFECCVCGKYLFVVGGTGPFRVIQNNLFYYNVEEERWSQMVELPCSGRQIKCCAFEDQLFILDINNKCGYLFNTESNQWTTVQICDAQIKLPFFCRNLVVFNYKNSLYIRESKLFELKMQSGKLLIVKETDLPKSINSNSRCLESVLSNGVLYTLSKQSHEETNEQITLLEAFDIENCTNTEIYKNVNSKNFKDSSSVIIFNVFHPNLVEKNDLIL